METYGDDHILEVEGVTKRYGDLTAIDDVSLAIEPGEIFALLGPNGAGKTTLINCVAGLLTHFEGEVRVAGYDVTVSPQVTRRLIGLVPQELKYDAFFTVRDVLEYQSGFFGLRPEDRRVDELLEAFTLSDKADERTRHLSGGMQRRLMICKALMHDPVLLFLDEPTAGVDVSLREELWEFVRRLRRRGTTIVLTTHYIEEAERLADRIGILNAGRLIRVDDRDDLLREFGVRRLEVEFVSQVRDGDLPEVEGLELERRGPRCFEMHYRVPGDTADGPTPVDRFVEAVGRAEVGIRSLEGERTSLEEIFKHLVFESEA